MRNRCHHRSRLGLPCFRVWVYDYWCGHHNGTCWWHTMLDNRHPWSRKAYLRRMA